MCFADRLWAAFAALPLAAVLVSGCSPTFNWRNVQLDSRAGPLVALLPCKPDRAERLVSFDGGAPVSLSMIGCSAGGATFTLAHLGVAPGTDAAAALSQWRAANAARLGAAEVQPDPSFRPPGATALTATGLATIEARDAAGQPVRQRSAWFARAGGGGIELFQAAVLGSKIDPAAIETFFPSLRLD